MDAVGWQIGAILVGLSVLIIAIYLAKLINSTTKVVEKAYKIVDYNERHIQDTIENVAAITKSTEDIVGLASGVTNITKVFRFFKK